VLLLLFNFYIYLESGNLHSKRKLSVSQRLHASVTTKTYKKIKTWNVSIRRKYIVLQQLTTTQVLKVLQQQNSVEVSRGNSRVNGFIRSTVSETNSISTIRAMRSDCVLNYRCQCSHIWVSGMRTLAPLLICKRFQPSRHRRYFGADHLKLRKKKLFEIWF
jgi:hypothetical protein